MLKSSYDSADAVPPELKEHYVANEQGKFIAEVEGHAERIRQLNSESKGHRLRAEAAEEKLADLEKATPKAEAVRALQIDLALLKSRATPEGEALLKEYLSQKLAADPAAKLGDLVTEARSRFPGAFLGTAGHGGGAPTRGGGNGGGRTLSRAQFDGMSPAQRSAAMTSGVRLID